LLRVVDDLQTGSVGYLRKLANDKDFYGEDLIGGGGRANAGGQLKQICAVKNLNDLKTPYA
jgi:hypothetical protein